MLVKKKRKINKLSVGHFDLCVTIIVLVYKYHLFSQ